jgi:transposase
MGLPILGLPQTTRIYLALEPVDMRKHYDGLWTLAAQHLGLDPKTGALFVLTNKSRDRIKLLHWDSTGVWVLAKRLEQGRFTWPASATGDSRKLTLDPAALTLLLDGIDLKHGAKKAWYECG